MLLRSTKKPLQNMIEYKLYAKPLKMNQNLNIVLTLTSKLHALHQIQLYLHQYMNVSILTPNKDKNVLNLPPKW